MRYQTKNYDALDRRINRIFARNHGSAESEYYSGPAIQTSSMTAAIHENWIGRGASRRASDSSNRRCE